MTESKKAAPVKAATPEPTPPESTGQHIVDAAHREQATNATVDDVYRTILDEHARWNAGEVEPGVVGDGR